MSTSLYDAIMAPPQRPEIVVQRSELERHVSCPAQARFERDQPIGDADTERLRDVGIAFHAIMAEYIDELLQSGQRHDPASLIALASAGDAALQPDLLHLAKLTGPRVSMYRPLHISHETQYAYNLAAYGPKGEDVVLTCCPDLVMQGNSPSSLWLPDWKTGWGKSGFEFQAMFYAVVMARSHEDIDEITWQPFFCRFGTWGPRHIFGPGEIDEAEAIIKQAIMQFLTETDWAPNPGSERCRICPYVERCDAERRFSDIEASAEDFARGTIKLEHELKARHDAMKAWVKGHGPIELDGQWYGANPMKEKVTYKWNKGSPGFLGEDEEAEGK